MTNLHTSSGPETRSVDISRSRRDASLATSSLALMSYAVAVIWLAVAACAIFAPDMISGSEHEHLPLAGMTDWFFAAVACGLLVTAHTRCQTPGRVVWLWVSILVSIVWLVVALTSIFCPSLVTGTDPTTIPLAALISPMVGTLVTAYLAVLAAATTTEP